MVRGMKKTQALGRDDVWLFIHCSVSVNYTDLVKAFVGGGKCSKQTFLNYKTSLEGEGKIAKKIGDSGRPVYFVPQAFRREAQETLQKKRVSEDIVEMTPEQLEFMGRILKQNAEVAFKQIIRTIENYGKDKVQVEYEWPRWPCGIPTPQELARRRQRREEIIRKARG